MNGQDQKILKDGRLNIGILGWSGKRDKSTDVRMILYHEYHVVGVLLALKCSAMGA
jgi:hypothetical protein